MKVVGIEDSGVPVMKKQIKKLVLSKETLRNLDEKDVALVLGGQSGSACGNPTCKQDCGPTALC
jgi:hypothetical protein